MTTAGAVPAQLPIPARRKLPRASGPRQATFARSRTQPWVTVVQLSKQ
jgi:hypothetical protein